MRRGFTLIELMVSIAVIGILITIVTIASQGAMTASRKHRANVMCKVLEQGLFAYYAQDAKGEWPSTIQNKTGYDGDSYTFDNSETDKIFQDVVRRSISGGTGRGMLLDASGLYVCESGNCGNGNNGCNDNHDDKDSTECEYCLGRGCRPGVDFSEAMKRGSKRPINLANMAFGFMGPVTGCFRRYRVTYNRLTDSVSVTWKERKFK